MSMILKFWSIFRAATKVLQQINSTYLKNAWNNSCLQKFTSKFTENVPKSPPRAFHQLQRSNSKAKMLPDLWKYAANKSKDDPWYFSHGSSRKMLRSSKLLHLYGVGWYKNYLNIVRRTFFNLLNFLFFSKKQKSQIN